MLKKIRKKKGQSTLEYIILVAAVVAALVVFLTGNNSMFRQAINSTYNQVLRGMNTRACELVDSWDD